MLLQPGHFEDKVEVAVETYCGQDLRRDIRAALVSVYNEFVLVIPGIWTVDVGSSRSVEQIAHGKVVICDFVYPAAGVTSLKFCASVWTLTRSPWCGKLTCDVSSRSKNRFVRCHILLDKAIARGARQRSICVAGIILAREIKVACHIGYIVRQRGARYREGGRDLRSSWLDGATGVSQRESFSY
jgi:hypothetical protein